jgi:hypothetical protein
MQKMKTHKSKISPEKDVVNTSAGILQAKKNKAVFLEDNRGSTIQKKTNNSGLPAGLKSGIENLSGISMNNVSVHYNSSKPAQLNAHAYAQGTDIHLASGQEKHLPHEAWHVVQQKQGRVKPTLQMKGKINVNDDKGLEKEADVMGTKALQLSGIESRFSDPAALSQVTTDGNVSQLVTRVTWTTQNFKYNNLAIPAQVDNQMVGKKMVADLDPADRRAGNEAGGVGMTPLFQSLNANWQPGAMGWVRGHLLNAHLGGPNTDPNLFPITGHANHVHLREVESHVKDWIRGNRHVRYEVTANQRGGNVGGIRNAAGSFHCYAYTTQGLPRLVVNKTISSLPAPLVAPPHAADVAVHDNNWFQKNNNRVGAGGVGNAGLASGAAMNPAARGVWNAAHARRGWFQNYYEL